MHMNAAPVSSQPGRKVAILSRGYKSKSVPLWRKAWCPQTPATKP